MTHSPTPWRIIDEHDEYIIRSADDEWLSSKARFDHSAFDRKDAEFIVRAVNSHEALVRGLTAARQALMDAGNEANWLCSGETLVLIEAGLSKAQEAQS